MKKSFLLLLLVLFCAAIGQGLYTLKDGFSARRIHALTDRVGAEWDAETDCALTKPFRYLGRGRQCFAFESEDQKYVLKILRTDIYQTPLWVRALPLKHYRKQLEAEHLRRKQFVLNSFALSFADLQDQTGIIASHLGQSPSKGQFLTLIDSLGCKHSLPLGTTPFILQHKHPILMQAFSKALCNGNQPEAKRILDAWIDVVVERGRRGILNKDGSFLRNYGFDGQKAYQIDVGSFYRNPQLTPAAAGQKSIRDSADRVREWLAQTNPEMLEYFNHSLAQKTSPNI